MRVAVFRALQLGDLLCAVPALRALRAALPSAEVTLIGLPWARELIDHLPGYIDGLLEFPGWPGLPERECDAAAVPGFLAAAQARHFDLAIQLHGNGSITNPIVALLGARSTAGFVGPGAPLPRRGRYIAYPDHGPEASRLVSLMEHLGFASRGLDPEFDVCETDRNALAELRAVCNSGEEPYVCIHPGARDPARCWMADAFAATADALAERGLRIVLTGSAAEHPRTDAVQHAMRHPEAAINLAGRTSLGTLAALLESAELLVCNDTGVSHLAAALRVPSVVVFVTSDPHRWAPLDGLRHRPVAVGQARETVDAVLREADALLGVRA